MTLWDAKYLGSLLNGGCLADCIRRSLDQPYFDSLSERGLIEIGIDPEWDNARYYRTSRKGILELSQYTKAHPDWMKSWLENPQLREAISLDFEQKVALLEAEDLTHG